MTLGMATEPFLLTGNFPLPPPQADQPAPPRVSGVSTRGEWQSRGTAPWPLCGSDGWGGLGAVSELGKHPAVEGSVRSLRTLAVCFV